jgi:hypothetical protein
LPSLCPHILTHHACADEEIEDEDDDDDEKFFSAEEGDFEGEGFESYLKGRGSRGRSGMARDGDRDSSSDSESRRSESKVAKVSTPSEFETLLFRSISPDNDKEK